MLLPLFLLLEPHEGLAIVVGIEGVEDGGLELLSTHTAGEGPQAAEEVGAEKATAVDATAALESVYVSW